MPLRLFIPLPGPFVWVSGGRRRRGRRVWPWAVLALAVAGVVYGAFTHWWIAAVVVAVVVAAGAALFASAVPAGQRGRFLRALTGRPNAADRADATRLLDEEIARRSR